MANAIINTGILVGTFWQLGEILKGKPADPDKQTTIGLVVGHGPNAGGSVPHVAVWDRNGNRIGQYKGDENGHIDDSNTKTIVINNDQNGGKQAQPEYISVVMQETDAICLSAIIASGDSAQWTWTGDMGYTCGAQWYHSDFTIGSSNNAPRCVWLDSDHTNGIIAKGLSLHIRDFSGDPDLVKQYSEDQRRLCQNSARMTFQPEPIVPDSLIPFFHPPLEYERSSDGKNHGTNDPSSGGALKKPNQGIDRKTRAYPDGTNMHIHDTKRRHARDLTPPALPSNVKGLKNNRPDHLVISHKPVHSAKEVCEHPSSLGPDFVSTVEKVFCDMETGKWWPLCDATHDHDCFDLEHRTMKGPGPVRGGNQARSPTELLPEKRYKTHVEWN
ncbi:hypothetical protein VTN00DRAFT_8370 [Thermoascus crustaceus]|uniref:uncharacterized protein n=1 Tax=Thermoascus crustaceus TaxID=5088 RepID=UPI0037446E3D